MTDAHGLVVWEVEPKPPGNLLRAPGACPPPMLSSPVPSLFPQHVRSTDRAPARRGDQPGEPILDIDPQLLVDCKLRRLRTPCCPLGMPLGRSGSIFQVTTACGRIAPQFP